MTDIRIELPTEVKKVLKQAARDDYIKLKDYCRKHLIKLSREVGQKNIQGA